MQNIQVKMHTITVIEHFFIVLEHKLNNLPEEVNVVIAAALSLCVDSTQTAGTDGGLLAVGFGTSRFDRDAWLGFGIQNHHARCRVKWVGNGDIIVLHIGRVHALVKENLSTMPHVTGGAVALIATHGTAVTKPVARLAIARVQCVGRTHFVGGDGAGTTL